MAARQHIVTGSTTYRCRCRICRARRNLSMHPGWYVRRPRCRGCGRLGTLAVDSYRQYGRERQRQNTCQCDGLMYSHRYGSRGCNHYQEPIPWDDGVPDHYGDEAPF